MTTGHCVLLAGGLGTRLVDVTGGLIPKALAEVGGIPFLHFKLLSLIQMGFNSIDILVGQHGDQIEQFIHKDDYSSVSIRCFRDGPTLLGTAGAIASILDELPKSFWVSYADTYVLADIELANREFDNEDENIMVVLHNKDQIETSNVSIDEVNQNVIEYVRNPPSGSYEWIDYGILRLNKASFSAVISGQPVDLREIIVSQIKDKRLRAFKTREFFWDIGTPDRLKETTKEFQRRGWI